MGFCVYLYRSYCKTIIGNQSLLSAVVFRCHHRELTEYFWRKAEKQHLCQQVSQPKKSCKPIFQVLVDTTKAFKCPHPAQIPDVLVSDSKYRLEAPHTHRLRHMSSKEKLVSLLEELGTSLAQLLVPLLSYS